MCPMPWWGGNNLPTEMPVPKAAGDEGPGFFQNPLLTLINTTVQLYVGALQRSEEVNDSKVLNLGGKSN